MSWDGVYNGSIDDGSNFIMFDDSFEDPEDIINDYLVMIQECRTNEELYNALVMFFNDVAYWQARLITLDNLQSQIELLKMMEETKDK